MLKSINKMSAKCMKIRTTQTDSYGILTVSVCSSDFHTFGLHFIDKYNVD